MWKGEEAGHSSLIQHISHVVGVTGFHLCRAASQSTETTTTATKSHVCSIDRDPDMTGPPVIYTPSAAQDLWLNLVHAERKEEKIKSCVHKVQMVFRLQLQLKWAFICIFMAEKA